MSGSGEGTGGGGGVLLGHGDRDPRGDKDLRLGGGSGFLYRGVPPHFLIGPLPSLSGCRVGAPWEGGLC